VFLGAVIAGQCAQSNSQHGELVMTHFVFVHGAWHGGWGFADQAQRLQAAGHTAWRPTLTGLGERTHLAVAPVNLDTHIEDIVQVLQYENLRDVVLCGHSYGGMVVAGVADRCAERLKALVFLDAYVPADGDTCWSLAGDFYRRIFVDGVGGDGRSVAPPAFLKQRDARFEAHPMASLTQALKLRNRGVGRVAKRGMAWARRHEHSPFTATYERLRNDPEWVVEAMDCGHNLMGEMPEQTAAFLLRFA
jgi:pimeloyl-ACP methyl ester carboxylesterase